MAKEPCIIGLDPGTTVGCAILDVYGNQRKIHSEKEFGMSDVIKLLYAQGQPVLIGCDKRKVPEFVEKCAVKVGAKVVAPAEDLSYEKKKELVTGMTYNNDHEMDALASALYAFKQYRSLLKKIEVFTRRYNKEDIRNELITAVIKKEKSITHVSKQFEHEAPEPAEPIDMPQEEITMISKQLYDARNAQYKKIKQENKLMRKELNKQKEYSARLEKRNSLLQEKMEKLVPQDHSDKVLNHREKTIVHLENELEKRNQRIKELCAQQERIVPLLSDGKYHALKRLKNLGWSEYHAAVQRNAIVKGDILWVDHPEEYSTNVHDLLRKKVDVIITPNPPKKHAMPFIFLDGKEIEKEETAHRVIVRKDALERLYKKSQLFNKIIREYKTERTATFQQLLE